MRKPISGLDPVREFPYYKLQFWEEQVLAWTDIQQKFASRDELLDHARDSLDGETRSRFGMIEDYGWGEFSRSAAR